MSSSDTLRFAVYLRISRDPDGTSTATKRQLDDCRRFAAIRGWDIVDTFEDADASAWRKGVARLDYERLLAAMGRGELDGVLVWRLDRLVRRTAEFARFWEAAEAHHVRLASATQPIDTSDPVGMLIVQILVAFAQMESETMSVRIRAQKAEAARNGKPVRGGWRPYGLTPDWSEIETGEAEVIRWAVEQVMAGVPLHGICRSLNEQGVPTVRGGPWQRRTLKRMLTSARLFGWREHDGELVAEGDWPAIIDEATGRALRQILGNGRDGASSGTRGQSRYLLGGMLRCGGCGARLVHSRSADHGRRYICPGKAVGGCSGTRVHADRSEDEVVGLVLDRLESRSVGQAAASRSRRGARTSEAEILAELSRLDGEVTRLARERLDGTLPRAAAIAEQQEIARRVDRLNLQLAETRRSQMDALALLEGAGQIVGRFYALSVDQQRAVLADQIVSIRVLRTSDPLFLTRLREGLAAEAEQYAGRAKELRAQAQQADDPGEARDLREEASDLTKAASRRRKQVMTGTGGGRWRPERLDIHWRA